MRWRTSTAKGRDERGNGIVRPMISRNDMDGRFSEYLRGFDAPEQ
jgi:hypothetical protein